MKILLTVVSLLFVTLSLWAKEIDITKAKGVDQERIVSLSPAPGEEVTKGAVRIKITLDEKLRQKGLHKAIRLRYLGCKPQKRAHLKSIRDKEVTKCKKRYKHNRHLKRECIRCARKIFIDHKKRNCKPKTLKGRTKYLQKRDMLVFIPHKRLRPGYYQVTLKGIKTKSGEKIKKIQYRFEVSKNSIASIALSQTDITLQEGESTTLTLQATYTDGTSAQITEDIHWITGDSSIVSIDENANLKALKAGETLIQAEYHGKVSGEVKVTVTPKAEIINGYTLPPEPDPKINNATLLGVDSNNNGIRDDVERFIIKKYKDHHKAVTEIGFQAARAYQKILANPLDWEENHKALIDAIDCNFYFRGTAEDYGDPVIVDHSVVLGRLKSLQLNTKSRVKAYLLYDRQLSGGVYDLTPYSQQKSKCSPSVLGTIGGAK